VGLIVVAGNLPFWVQSACVVETAGGRPQYQVGGCGIVAEHAIRASADNLIRIVVEESWRTIRQSRVIDTSSNRRGVGSGIAVHTPPRAEISIRLWLGLSFIRITIHGIAWAARVDHKTTWRELKVRSTSIFSRRGRRGRGDV